MNNDKNTEPTSAETTAADLSEKDLDQVAGGAATATGNRVRTVDKSFHLDSYVRG